MPIKNIIFDLGQVLVRWNPKNVVETFTTNPQTQQKLLHEVFLHQRWQTLDHGLTTESIEIPIISQATSLSHQIIKDALQHGRESLDLIKNTETLLYELQAEGYSLYCLSNMSIETFSHIRKEHSFWGAFNGIVISGQEKVMKPQKEIYQILLQRYKLQANESLFIDDRDENINAAQQQGIHGILFSETHICYEEIKDFLKMKEL